MKTRSSTPLCFTLSFRVQNNLKKLSMNMNHYKLPADCAEHAPE
jgi:hypothetical protein